MSIFSNFVNSDVRIMFNFVEIYRFVTNPLTISQNFTSISFFVKKLLQKTFGGFTQPPLGERGLTIVLIQVRKDSW